MASVVVIATLAIGGLAGATECPDDRPAPAHIAAAVESLAGDRGIREPLITSVIRRHGANGGGDVFAVKILDPADGTIELLHVDGAGEPLDSRRLDEAALTAARARRIGADLAAAMVAQPDAVHPVLIALDRRPVPRLPRPEIDDQRPVPTTELDAIAVQATLARRASVVRPAARVLAALRELDPNATHDRGSPLVRAQLDRAAIETIAAHADVRRLYLDATRAPAVGIARRVVKADSVIDLGIDGSGVRLGVIEVGGKYRPNNAYLQHGLVQDLTNVKLSSHTTAVVGFIRSTDSEQRGVAPKSRVWVGGSRNGLSSQLQSAADRATDWGATAINLSFGTETGGDLDAGSMFFDDLVFTRRVTVVAAAGNEGEKSGHIFSPGNGYNLITVGNFNDVATTSWSDDVMSPTSSWRDPDSMNGDRAKPDVVAPGTGLTSTTLHPPWIGPVGSGTSFAAPIVTGVVGLLMQRKPALRSWPEGVRAVLLATALNNIEDGRRLSRRDGTGGIDARRADQIVRGVNGGYVTRNYDCGRPDDWRVRTVTLSAGKRARIVIAWSTDPSYNLYDRRPSADLDLVVVGPGGAIAASSTSLDNTFEIVDFTPATTGVYEIRVQQIRCSKSPDGLGVAWYQK